LGVAITSNELMDVLDGVVQVPSAVYKRMLEFAMLMQRFDGENW
jgi:hypothetical protein